MKSPLGSFGTGLMVLGSALLLFVAACRDEGSSEAAANSPAPQKKNAAKQEEAPAPVAHSCWLSARADDLNTGISNSRRDAVLGREAWTWLAAGRLWQSPVARDGVLYVGDGNLDFYAIRVSDGHQLWRSRPTIIKTKATEIAGPEVNLAERALPHDLDDHYGYSIPVLDDHQVITISEYGVMTSFDIKDGTVLWEHDFGAKVMSSPRIKGNKILVNCTDGNFFAFDKRNGNELWRYWTSAKMLGSSCAFLGPKTVVFPGHDGILHFVDIDTGKAKKRIPLDEVSASTPVVAFGCIYFTAKHLGLCCYDLVEDHMRWNRKGTRAASHSLALSGENILVHMRSYLFAYHGVTGAVAWKVKLGSGGAVAPCVGPKLVYVTTDKATIFAIDRKTGAVKWTREFGEGSRSHPVLVDGLVLVSNLKGRMTAFE